MSRISEWNLTFTNSGCVPAHTEYMRPCRHVQSFSEIEAVRKAIEDLAYVEPNWDGYDALAISAETKRNALNAQRTLETVAPPPSVIPNSNGTLSFEWETERGIGHLEIGRTRYSFYVRPTIARVNAANTYANPILSDGDVDKIAGFLGTIVDGILYPKPSEPVYLNPKFLATNV
jgi:hypothetical protein